MAASDLYNAAGNIKRSSNNPIPKTVEPHRTLLAASNLVTGRTAADLKVQPGQAYYIELAASSNATATFVVGRVLSLFRTTRGLISPDYEDRSCIHQKKTGANSWVTQTGGAGFTHMGVSLHFDG